jgi:hypothetical protein
MPIRHSAYRVRQLLTESQEPLRIALLGGLLCYEQARLGLRRTSGIGKKRVDTPDGIERPEGNDGVRRFRAEE